jgi:hypothetical protein
MLAEVSEHHLCCAVPDLQVENQIHNWLKTSYYRVQPKDRTHTDDEGDCVVVPIYSRLEFPLGELHSLRDIQIVKVNSPFIMSLQSSEDLQSQRMTVVAAYLVIYPKQNFGCMLI